MVSQLAAEKEETGWRNCTYFSLIQPGNNKVDQNWVKACGFYLNKREAGKCREHMDNRGVSQAPVPRSPVFCVKSLLHITTRLSPSKCKLTSFLDFFSWSQKIFQMALYLWRRICEPLSFCRSEFFQTIGLNTHTHIYINKNILNRNKNPQSDIFCIISHIKVCI